MPYKCLDCGHIFERGEEAEWVEVWGEVGEPQYRIDMTGCPICKGGFEETKRCAVCDGEHLDQELVGGVCESCIDSYRYNAQVCYKVGRVQKESVEINSFLASIYSPDQIEELIWREILETQKIRPVDCSPFIESSDPDWFAENLAKEVNKSEC